MPDQYGMRTDKEVLADREKERQAAYEKMLADQAAQSRIRAEAETKRAEQETQRIHESLRRGPESPTSSKTSIWVWIAVIIAVIYLFGK
jgi:uncharacterized protein YhaN